MLWNFQSYIPPEQLQQQQQQRQNFQSYIPPEQLQQQHQQQQNYYSYNPQNQQQQRQVFPSQYVSEEFVQTQTLPTVQQPIFAKVKQPTILNHFETEPYKKILNRSTQQPPPPHQQQQQQYSSVAHKRYQDPPNFNDNMSYAEDFDTRNKQTYYPGQKVDQGKMIIRDYSKQKSEAAKCNCNEQHEQTDEDNEESPIKSGYVSHVAKLWDNRMKSSHKISPSKKNDMQGLSTIV